MDGDAPGHTGTAFARPGDGEGPADQDSPELGPQGPRQGRGSRQEEGARTPLRFAHRPRYVAPSVVRPLSKGGDAEQERNEAGGQRAIRTRVSGLLAGPGQ